MLLGLVCSLEDIPRRTLGYRIAPQGTTTIHRMIWRTTRSSRGGDRQWEPQAIDGRGDLGSIAHRFKHLEQRSDMTEDWPDIKKRLASGFYMFCTEYRLSERSQNSCRGVIQCFGLLRLMNLKIASFLARSMPHWMIWWNTTVPWILLRVEKMVAHSDNAWCNIAW